MRFERVSMGVFYDALIDIYETKENMPFDFYGAYKDIKLPKQATAYSAGMDFFAPFDIRIEPESQALVPTGVRWQTGVTERGHVLVIFPRSGLGFKTGMRLANTAGIIDPDYCDSDNEGHIMLKIVNPQKEKSLDIPKGKAFAQGIIIPFAICEGAESDDVRNGGFGSTDKR